MRRRLAGLLQPRVDLIGVASVFADDAGRYLDSLPAGDARDVRLRIAASDPSRANAERLLREMTALYTCGPAGGGGVRTSIRSRLDIVSCFVPREAIRAGYEVVA